MNRRTEQNAAAELEVQDLIRRFLEGDNSAMDRIIRNYQDMVYHVSFRLIGDAEDAADCAQETFVRLFRFVKNFRFGSKFSTYLYRIAVNTSKNHLASRSYQEKQKSVNIDDLLISGNAGELMGTGRYSPTARVESSEVSKIVQQAIRQLPGPQRVVAVLRDIEGKSYEEIAQITGQRMGTVKSKLARARRKLCELLKGRV